MIIPLDSPKPLDAARLVGLGLSRGIIIPYCHAENTIANNISMQVCVCAVTPVVPSLRE